MILLRNASRGPGLAAIISSAAWQLSLGLVTLGTATIAPSAIAQTANFTAIGSYGAYRLDGVRDGSHEGAPVRLVDMTVHNRSDQMTFPETIQTVWWQGRNTGEKVEARRRDLSRFGMYDYVAPGTMVAVTYIIPVRDDIDGIRVDYMKAAKGQQERRWSWDELIGGGPGRLYHNGRPVGAPTTTASEPAPAAHASAAPAAEPAHAQPAAPAPSPRRTPDMRQVTGAINGLTQGRTTFPTKKAVRGLLADKLKSLSF